MKKYLFLDDERVPKTDFPWTIVRSYNEAIEYVNENGMPDMISFDHDINSEPYTGYSFAKWLVEQAMDEVLEFPEGFDFHVHSANPVGRVNIEMYLNSYLTHIGRK